MYSTDTDLFKVTDPAFTKRLVSAFFHFCSFFFLFFSFLFFFFSFLFFSFLFPFPSLFLMMDKILGEIVTSKNKKSEKYPLLPSLSPFVNSPKNLNEGRGI